MIPIKKYLYAFLILLAGCMWIPCHAQKKYEREYAIRQSAVPGKAVEFVKSMFKKDKIHWYGEESLKETTIEAKLKSGGKHYSIEFDKSGEIQDIEILSRFSRIDAETSEAIRKRLDKEFTKYKVVKTQIQYKGSKSDLKRAILSDKVPAAIDMHYELILNAVWDKKINYFEVLCDHEGSVVSIHEVVQRNSDNLIY
ncbi:hypothetical protein [Dyadobacter sediminis]|uniref:PepSY domain-containing protein n=1 Tax=Dyadobacter sediminis TaxID=1493691 RepID=A0A5R9KKD6_9BACT|nr:hypothetical protein [Dyadobacter sediminis]TLU96644.1 hypothetical protein FEM55_05835 [Dyadobacter sediminis]GGB83988.1 hypothetical protein GCM10011325_09450 [Dyadobacter sediminis]